MYKEITDALASLTSLTVDVSARLVGVEAELKSLRQGMEARVWGDTVEELKRLEEIEEDTDA